MSGKLSLVVNTLLIYVLYLQFIDMWVGGFMHVDTLVKAVSNHIKR